MLEDKENKVIGYSVLAGKVVKIIAEDKEAKRFTKKICQHYKAKPITLKFNAKRKGTGSANWETQIVRLPHNPSVGLLAHELTHILTESGHTKKGLIMLEKVILYARKKNYWKII